MTTRTSKAFKSSSRTKPATPAPTTITQAPKRGTAKIRPGLAVIDNASGEDGGIITHVFRGTHGDFVIWEDLGGDASFQAVSDIIVPDAGTLLDRLADGIASLMSQNRVSQTSSAEMPTSLPSSPDTGRCLPVPGLLVWDMANKDTAGIIKAVFLNTEQPFVVFEDANGCDRTQYLNDCMLSRSGSFAEQVALAWREMNKQ